MEKKVISSALFIKINMVIFCSSIVRKCFHKQQRGKVYFNSAIFWDLSKLTFPASSVSVERLLHPALDHFWLRMTTHGIASVTFLLECSGLDYQGIDTLHLFLMPTLNAIWHQQNNCVFSAWMEVPPWRRPMAPFSERKRDIYVAYPHRQTQFKMRTIGS